MAPCSRPGRGRLPNIRCRPTRVGPTVLAALGLTLLIALGMTAALPGAAEAVVCNVNSNIDLTTAHNFLIPPESYTVTAQVTTGNISGGTADIHRFRFELDCDPDNQLFIGCSNTGNSPAEVNYDGDSLIAPGTTCKDTNGNQLFVNRGLGFGRSKHLNFTPRASRRRPSGTSQRTRSSARAGRPTWPACRGLRKPHG